eukprot:85257_1
MNFWRISACLIISLAAVQATAMMPRVFNMLDDDEMTPTNMPTIEGEMPPTNMTVTEGEMSQTNMTTTGGEMPSDFEMEPTDMNQTTVIGEMPPTTMMQQMGQWMTMVQHLLMIT